MSIIQQRELDLLRVSIEAHAAVRELITTRRKHGIPASRKILDIEAYLHRLIVHCQENLKNDRHNNSAFNDRCDRD